MLTKGRAGLLKRNWVSLSVIAALLCTFIVHSGVQGEWGTTVNPSGRIFYWGTQNLKNLRGFHEYRSYG